MLVRTQWIEGIGRYETPFRDQPPSLYAPFVERVPFVTASDIFDYGLGMLAWTLLDSFFAAHISDHRV